jgi:hypothetical protein
VAYTDSNGTSYSSTVAVTTDAQVLTAIAITPTTATIAQNATQAFTATATDQDGNAIAVTPTWSKVSGVGSINSSSGVYTAPAATGSAVVRATSGAVNSNTAAITVSNATPTVATPAAASPSTVTASTSGLTVLGADDAGESGLTYTWSATTKPSGASPTFSANGTNAAKASTVTFDRAGSYVLTCTISDGTASTTSATAITVSQTLTTATVSPSTASVALSGTQQFTASGFDQFASAMTATWTWSKTSGVGSVNASGLYTAPATAGVAVVRATSGSVYGEAGVTVVDGPGFTIYNDGVYADNVWAAGIWSDAVGDAVPH